MCRGYRLLKMGLITAAFCMGHVAVSAAETPSEQVKKTVGRVIEILQEAGNNGDVRKVEKKQRVRQILLPRFDFAEMAKRSLGNHWRGQNGRQEEFVSVFTDFVENSYMGTLESYKGEKIVYLRERVDQNLAQVDTQIIPTKGEPIPVNYKLHLVGGDWKIYDVVIENISLVNNFRSQFNRILTAAPFDELLKKMRQKGPEKPI